MEEEQATKEGHKPLKMKRLTLDLPEELHLAIKINAVHEGVTMAQKLRDLLLQHYDISLNQENSSTE